MEKILRGLLNFESRCNACEQLLWKQHINTVCAKATNPLELLSRIRHCLTTKAALCIFNTLIDPIFSYVDVVWSELSVECCSKLQRLQNRAARIIAKCDSSADAFDILKWKDLETKRKLHKCILVYKCLNNLVPDYLGNYFNKNLDYHNYNTRRKRDLHLPQPKRNLGKRTFKYFGAILCNSLPMELNSIDSLSSFKTRIKHYF